MKLVHWTLASAVALAVFGCAGKLDLDPSYFASRSSRPVRDAGVVGEDAAAGPASNPEGGAPSTLLEEDAGESGDPEARAPGLAAAAGMAAAEGGSGAPAVAGGSAMAAGGAGGLGGAPVAAPACDFRGLLQTKCGNGSCHGAPASNTGLDLTSAALAMRVAGRRGASACSDRLLIDTDRPEDSVLYLRVVGTSCGVRMPLGGTMTAAEQACVLSWIEGL